MSSLKETIVRMTKKMFRCAAFGVALCVGTTILLYRIIIEWLKPARSLPPSVDEEDERETRSTSRLDWSFRKHKTSSVDDEVQELLQCHELGTEARGSCLSEVNCRHSSAEGLRHRHPAVFRIQDNFTNFNQLSYEDAATSSFCDSKLTDVSSNGKEFEDQDSSMLNNNTQDPLFPVVSLPSTEMFSEGVSRYPANLENWSFSLNTEHSRSCLQDSSISSSVDPIDYETQCPPTVVKKPGNGDRSLTDLQRYRPPFQDFLDHNFSFASSAFSPNVLCHQHSTPDDQQTVAMTSRLERTGDSIFKPVNEHQDDYVSRGDCNDKSFAMNTISLHDFSARESRRSRSCASLDDSMFFVNDLALFDTPCANDICTAVTSLEQLEREVAGVMSDCGEMQHRVGVLRLHDRHDKVAKRYSLGVADSVIASDARLFSMCDHRDMSLVAEAQNLSNSIGNGRDSGYIWDDDLLEIQLAPRGSKRRSSRSFSLPRSF